MEDFENVATTEEETVVLDNSEDETSKEPEEKTDNSNEEKETEPKEETTDLIGGKFKTTDDLLNAYNAIEKQRGETSKELGELRKVKEQYEQIQAEREQIAKAYGYNTVEEMQQASQQMKLDQDIVNFTADEYAKHIKECEFPEEMSNLLMRYKQNPSDELLNTIEEEFSNGTLKEVAANLALRKGQLDFERQQALNEQIVAEADSYLNDVTAKYNDTRYFQNEAFRSLFADLFKSFGTNLKADYAIEKIEAYVQSRIADSAKQKASINENAQATDAIEGLSGSSSDEGGKSVMDMDEAELKRALRSKYKDI